ncbi:MAG TPA: triose-phosphate isomerase [Burkholderiaceae bacterium]|nr:triose-phosphate isomerase [Burkholderiaceae bacterium]
MSDSVRGRRRKPLVIGNWKMNGDVASGEALLAGLSQRVARRLLARVDVAVCPPYPYLGLAAARLTGSGIGWGAQDVAEFDNGAYTGEVSAAMLADLGCAFALVGHSERRTLFAETDETVARKAERLLAAGVIPVVCVGETLAEREQGRTEQVLARQLRAVAPVLAGADASRAVVAYEPVWAIGTGRTATPELAQQAHAFIRGELAAAGVAFAQSLRLLYGGSVKAANAAGLLGQPDVDGGLIGGASLDAAEFAGICEAALGAAGDAAQGAAGEAARGAAGKAASGTAGEAARGAA